MYTRSKLALVGLTATLVMVAAVGSASARNLSVSNTSFRAVGAHSASSAKAVSKPKRDAPSPSKVASTQRP